MIMKKRLLSLTLAQTLLLSACGQITNNTTVADKNAPAPENVTIAAKEMAVSGEQAVMVSANRWLGVHPDSGMQLRVNGNISDSKNIPAEFIDQRTDEQGVLYVSLDSQQNRLMSYRIQAEQISDLRFGPVLPYPLEGLCLYQPADNELNVFMLDENQMAHQLLISLTEAGLQQQEIRQFPLPPGSEYCIVDDATDQLFVSEENIGVWAYNARAESEVVRSVVDLVRPYGQLSDNAGPLAISQGRLLIAESGTAVVRSYVINQQGVSAAEHWQLDQPIAADSLTASQHNGRTTLALLDDESGALYQAVLTLPARETQPARIPQLAASAETTPVRKSGDAADDPAIWVNKQQPEQSRVLGTNKKYGLYVYDMQGNELQELKAGRVNNVDVRQGFSWQGQAADIAAASQRDRHAIALFHIDPASGQVSAAGEITTTLDDVYGMCMYRNNAGEFFVFINDEDGRFEQYAITDSQHGWQGRKVREFAVGSQPEGCAADDSAQRLFIGEEDVAVWTLGAEPGDSTGLTQVAAASETLVADIEGMDIYRTANEAYLIVSSQGNDSYVLYEAEAPYRYLGRFRIGINAAAGIDGASETDGLTVTSAALGAEYPQGMLVVQDGRNMLPDEKQNFKYVSWSEVKRLLNLH